VATDHILSRNLKVSKYTSIRNLQEERQESDICCIKRREQLSNASKIRIVRDLQDWKREEARGDQKLFS